MTAPATFAEVEINSIIDLLRDMSARYKDNQLLWYRGHARSSWLLEPSLVRKGGLDAEEFLINEFKRDAIPLLARAELSGEPMSEWDWLFVMQHYQVPTRLMDWTESPLIGLFFSLDDEHVKEGPGPACLWALEPKVMNEAARIETKYPTQVPICDMKDEDVYRYLPSGLNAGTRQLEPLAVAANRRFDRIRAQLGVFTIIHKKSNPLEQEVPQALTKYVIPTGSKEQIRAELSRLGFHAASMYPDLEHLGRRVAGSI